MKGFGYSLSVLLFSLTISFSHSVALAQKTFPPGLYYVKPKPKQEGGKILRLKGKMPRPVNFTGTQGFDIADDFIVTIEYDVESEQSYIVKWMAEGSQQRIAVAQGLYELTRPSISSDATQVAVQATEAQGNDSALPEFFSIYIIDLTTGEWTELVPPSEDPSAANELPEWFPSGDRVAYWAVEDDCLVIKTFDIGTDSVALTIRREGTTGCYQPENGVMDGPRFHTTITKDSSKLLIVGQMQIYDAENGSLLADIHQEVMDALASAGYEPDDRFPGQSGGGTFPLDATFSPDGSKIVFDGAVSKNGKYGILLMQINVDGTGFKILKKKIKSNPNLSNNHNYSQVNPLWH